MAKEIIKRSSAPSSERLLLRIWPEVRYQTTDNRLQTIDIKHQTPDLERSDPESGVLGVKGWTP